MMHNNNLKIMLSLVKLLGFKLSLFMLLAILNGSLGFLFSIAITVLGALGIAKLLGEQIILSYPLIITLILLAGSLRGVLRYIEQYSNHLIAFKILAVLRDKIFVSLTSLYPAKLEDKKKGSIISMISSDIETLEVFYAHTISPIFIALISSISISLFIGLTVNFYMALWAVFSYLLVGYFAPKISLRYLEKSGSKYRKQLTDFSGYYMDLVKGSNNIILTSNQKTKLKSVNELTDKLLEPHNELKTRSARTSSFVGILVVILNFSMLALGLFLASNNIVSIPLVLVGVVALMSSFGPVLAISNLPDALTQTFASAKRVLALLDEKPAISDIKNKDDFRFEKLEIKDLVFSYNQEHPVIKNFSLSITQGEILAIHGKSGCGKSTILNLLLRFWEKDSGQILFNGQDISSINTKSLRDNVTLVSQTTYLFNDSIKNNLLIANKGASFEQIVAACKSASVHDFIMSLKSGYDTVYSPQDGLDFSSGEKQRIGLARAFLSSATLLLLDEPTSDVDTINEAIILTAIKKNISNKAVIIVSHKESTLAVADKIIKVGV